MDIPTTCTCILSQRSDLSVRKTHSLCFNNEKVIFQFKFVKVTIIACSIYSSNLCTLLQTELHILFRRFDQVSQLSYVMLSSVFQRGYRWAD